MDITSVITITELSRITKKSRPTLYKYIEDFKDDRYGEIPEVMLELFINISKGIFSKKDIYNYCDKWFLLEQSNQVDKDLLTLINLLKDNKDKIDLKKYIVEVKKEIE